MTLTLGCTPTGSTEFVVESGNVLNSQLRIVVFDSSTLDGKNLDTLAIKDSTNSHGL